MKLEFKEYSEEEVRENRKRYKERLLKEGKLNNPFEPKKVEPHKEFHGYE